MANEQEIQDQATEEGDPMGLIAALVQANYDQYSATASHLIDRYKAELDAIRGETDRVWAQFESIRGGTVREYDAWIDRMWRAMRPTPDVIDQYREGGSKWERT